MKKEIQEYILEVLKLLSVALPQGKHSFMLGEDGRLWLWVAISDKWQSIIFDEDYKDVSAKALVDDIINTLKKAGYEIRSNQHR